MKTKATILSDGSGPVIFFGLVGAVGTDLDLAVNTLQDSLRNANYASRVIKVIDQLTPADTGGFYAYDGKRLPW